MIKAENKTIFNMIPTWRNYKHTHSHNKKDWKEILQTGNITHKLLAVRLQVIFFLFNTFDNFQICILNEIKII